MINNEVKINSLEEDELIKSIINSKDIKKKLRLMESISNPKAEPYKLWLAQIGKERIDEIFDPEIVIKRAITYYRNRGYSDRWIAAKLKEILEKTNK